MITYCLNQKNYFYKNHIKIVISKDCLIYYNYLDITEKNDVKQLKLKIENTYCVDIGLEYCRITGNYREKSNYH